jgi:hypothetical protein
MHKISIISILILVCSFGLGQTYQGVQLADSLLKNGRFKAAVTTYDFPNEIKVLQDKALTALKNNPKLSDKYIVTQLARGDKDLKFLEAYELKRDEFEKMLDGFKAGQIPVYSDTSQIAIDKSKSLITFKCSQKLSLFNFLRIDINAKTIYFDNIKVTKELAIDGKFYAPILKGIECHSSEEINTANKQSDITYFGLAIGTNKNDFRPTLCLLYGKPTNGGEISRPQFLIMTIL